MSIKVANGSLVQHKGTIPGRVGSARVGSARLTCDYNAISVQLQLKLPTGTELGKKNAKKDFSPKHSLSPKKIG